MSKTPPQGLLFALCEVGSNIAVEEFHGEVIDYAGQEFRADVNVGIRLVR